MTIAAALAPFGQRPRCTCSTCPLCATSRSSWHTIFGTVRLSVSGTLPGSFLTFRSATLRSSVVQPQASPGDQLASADSSAPCYVAVASTLPSFSHRPRYTDSTSPLCATSRSSRHTFLGTVHLGVSGTLPGSFLTLLSATLRSNALQPRASQGDQLASAGSSVPYWSVIAWTLPSFSQRPRHADSTCPLCATSRSSWPSHCDTNRRYVALPESCLSWMMPGRAVAGSCRRRAWSCLD